MNKLKKLVSFVYILCFCFLLFSCSKQQNIRTLTVGIEENLPPYSYYQSDDSNGSVKASDYRYLNGFYVKFVSLIAEKAGYDKVEFKTCEIENAVENLQNGLIDCFVSKNFSVNQNIIKSNSFFYSNSATLVLRAGSYDPSYSLDDIKNSRISVLKNSPEEKSIVYDNVKIINGFDEIKNCFDKNECDAIVCDSNVARIIRSQSEIPLEYKNYVSYNCENDDYCHYFYVLKSNSSLIDILNLSIAEFTLDKGYKMIEKEIDYFK